MKLILLLTVTALLMVIFSGCAAHMVVPQPGTITLESAMASVGKGFVALHDAEGPLRTGLIPSDAQVTFNISASGTDSQKIYVELSPISSSPVQGKLGGEANSSYTATRGNQITINFKNILLVDPKTIDANSALFKEIRHRVEGGGGVINMPAREP